MRIKRFVAKNMQQARMMVREELGDNAVIMSTHYLDDGVELTAGVDSELSVTKTPFMADQQHQATAPQQATQFSSMAKAAHYSPPQTTGLADVASMHAELKAMRAILEQQLSGFAWQQTQVQDPGKVALLKRLMAMGLGWEYSQQLVNQLTLSGEIEADWRLIQADILANIPSTSDTLVDQGGIIALIGPTGVGKTTTIAKLAARYALRHGTSNCALVSLDTYKIGAQEQLKIFADLIGIRLHTARTPAEFFRLLDALSSKHMVLVDTAGLSQRDARLYDYLAQSLDDGTGEIQPLLVLSAATQLSVMQEIMLAFGRLKPKGCILSKLDEATLLGPAITLLAQHQLPLTYCTNGQRVPEDLAPITARDLLDQAITMGRVQTEHGLDAVHYGFGREVTNV